MNKYEVVTFERKTGKTVDTGVFMFLEDEEIIPMQIEKSTAKYAFLLHIIKWNV
jgi:hypothetical protein